MSTISDIDAENAPAEIVLPDFHATWWPLCMETVLGSGEAINVAVVVRADNGCHEIRKSVSPGVLARLFDTAGEGVVSMVGTTVACLQKQLDKGVSIEDLDMPFGGFALGEPHPCQVRDMCDVFNIGVRLSTAFGVKTA